MNVSTVTIRVFSWLDGLTYRRQQRGSRVQAPIFCCGNVFISYLHSRKCPWYEMAFFIYKTKGLCIGVCSMLHATVCACVKVMHRTFITSAIDDNVLCFW